MRKRLISRPDTLAAMSADGWLDLEQAALVEVTSEADGYPVEGALLPDRGRGWRAATAGTQFIRLLFDKPQNIRAIQLLFKETQAARTQEFLLRWLPHGSASWRDVVRQQWNFSPPHTVEEREEYEVELASAAALELSVTPAIGQPGLQASLESLRISVQG